MSAILNTWPVGLLCFVAGVACCHQFAVGVWSPGRRVDNVRVVLGITGAVVFIGAATGILSGAWS